MFFQAFEGQPRLALIATRHAHLLDLGGTQTQGQQSFDAGQRRRNPGVDRVLHEPLELLPMLVMFLAQCGVIACKYGVLPASHTSDAHGKIYRPIKPADLTRTLILGAWNDPKNANHFDLLKMEIENASS